MNGDTFEPGVGLKIPAIGHAIRTARTMKAQETDQFVYDALQEYDPAVGVEYTPFLHLLQKVRPELTVDGLQASLTRLRAARVVHQLRKGIWAIGKGALTLEPNGRGQKKPRLRRRTVNDPALMPAVNADMVLSEINATLEQLAKLESVCRGFKEVYKQLMLVKQTLSNLGDKQ